MTKLIHVEIGDAIEVNGNHFILVATGTKLDNPAWVEFMQPIEMVRRVKFLETEKSTLEKLMERPVAQTIFDKQKLDLEQVCVWSGKAHLRENGAGSERVCEWRSLHSYTPGSWPTDE